MRNWILAALTVGALIQQGALAQVTYPPTDTSGLATKTEVQAAQSTATAAQTAANSACVATPSVPNMEIPGGAAGTNTGQCRPVDSAQPRITRTGLFTVGNGGNITCGGSTTCTWSTPLPAGSASYPMFFTAIGTAAAPSIRCKVLSSTNTGFSAQCTQAAATVNILGASVELLATSGTQVYALALPSTQASQ